MIRNPKAIQTWQSALLLARASGGLATGGGTPACGLARPLAGFESAVTTLYHRGEEVEEKAETVVAPAGFVGGSDDLAVEFSVDKAAEGDFVLCALAGHGESICGRGREGKQPVVVAREQPGFPESLPAFRTAC